MKRTIRLTESDLHRVIKESVKRILSEDADYVHRGEDATEYLDQYVPHRYQKKDTRGMFLNYDDPSDYADGENWVGSHDYYAVHDMTDEFNKGVDDINQRMYDRLSTKGGQMDYDWEKRENMYPTSSDEMWAKRKQELDDIDASRERFGRASRNMWLNGSSKDDMNDILGYTKEKH